MFNLAIAATVDELDNADVKTALHYDRDDKYHVGFCLSDDSRLIERDLLAT